MATEERERLKAGIAQDPMPEPAAEPAVGEWGQPPKNIPGKQFALHNHFRLSGPENHIRSQGGKAGGMALSIC